jgi:hypothetical protein
MQRNLLFVLFTISVFSFCGCSTRWEENSIDGPWVAPGVHTRELTRTYLPFYSPDAEHITFWTTANGGREEAYKNFDSSMRYLEELGYFDRWPKTGDGYDNYDQRLAPFTFHIIAIDPTIMVMVPHNFGNSRAGRSISEIVGQQPAQGMEMKYMINFIEYGTSFPYDPNVLWFSPDLRVPPSPVKKTSDSEQEIVNEKIKIAVTKEGDVWKSKREQP